MIFVNEMYLNIYCEHAELFLFQGNALTKETLII